MYLQEGGFHKIKNVLIKAHPITPSKRWQCIPKLSNHFDPLLAKFLKFKNSRRQTLIGNKAIHGVRRFSKSYLTQLFFGKLIAFPYVVLNVQFIKKPLTEVVIVKSLYNHIKLYPHSELLHPGFKLYPCASTAADNMMLNQMLLLSQIPLNGVISSVFNNLNVRVVFARSSGAMAIRRKDLKKTKLIYVELPSNKLTLLPNFVLCTFAPKDNLFLHKVNEGKWGYSRMPKKVLTVRGVAKNPVDHPNGGRTKAKQPELSPWGWIAKKTK